MKNNSKHTPGPWIVKPIKDGFHDGKAFIFGPQLDKSEYRPAPVVLLVEKPCKDKDEHAANLRLCAAAPELLAALEAQEAASSERSMTIHYQDSEESAKTYDQKKYAHDNYLESAAKADILQDRATELRRAAIAKAKGE